MRIAQVIKAKKLTPGVRVLVFDAEGQPTWNRVVAVEAQHEAGWLDVELEGIRGIQDVPANTRVVVWK